jgi:hypothetical protein
MGKQYTGAIHANLKAGTALEFTGFLPIVCSTVTVAGSITASSPAVGTISTLTFGGCKLGAFNCTFTSVNTPYALTVPSTSAVNVASGGSGNPGFSLTCLGVTCVFQTGNAGATLGFTGGEPATITAAKVPLTVTSGTEGTCGKTAELDATYVVDTPSSLWLT